MAKSKTKKNISKNPKKVSKVEKLKEVRLHSDRSNTVTVTTVLVAVLFTLTVVYAVQSYIWS